MVKPWADKLLDNDVKGATVAMLAEIAELRAELEKAKLHIKHIGNDALRAENAALREELAEETKAADHWMLVPKEGA